MINQSLNLSRRAFWAFATVSVLLYLVTWLVNFRYVYGWIMDDRYYYIKGVATVQDWRNAFTYFNYVHSYHYLISYVPLASGIALDSYSLPGFGEDTGRFRFFLLYIVFLHAILLTIWAVVIEQFASNRLVAAVGLLFFTTSPSLIFWSPLADSRMLGMLFFLPAWLLLHRCQFPFQGSNGAAIGKQFIIGSCLGVAQSIQYTTLYVIVPVCIVYWVAWFIRCRHVSAYWWSLGAFVLGCAWLAIVYEVLSGLVLGIPWDRGPFMTMVERVGAHRSHWTREGDLVIWGELFLNQLGPVLAAFMLFGWIRYLIDNWRMQTPGNHNSMRLAVAILLGMVYLLLSGAQAMFRQISVLLPFLYFFVAYGVVGLVGRKIGARTVGVVVLGVVVVVTGFHQWRQSVTVFNAHLSLGRVLEWAELHRGDRPLVWLRIAWFADEMSKTTLEDLEQTPPDAWLISYFPWDFVNSRPSVVPYLEATEPVFFLPSLYATDTMWAELRSRGYNDFRHDAILRDVRITEVGALLAATQGRPLRVRSVTADSVADPAAEPVNVFDDDASPDGVTAWASANTGGPHHLEIQFEEVARLGSIWLVLPPSDRSTSRISVLEIQAADERGQWRRVWVGEHLERYPVIEAHWKPMNIAAIKVIIRRQTLPTGVVDQATVEEVIFPGFRVVAPQPVRAFQDLVLRDLRLNKDGIVASGRGVTRHTVIVVNGRRLPTRQIPGRDQLLSSASRELFVTTGSLNVYLTDGFRRSNTMWLVSPGSTTQR